MSAASCAIGESSDMIDVIISLDAAVQRGFLYIGSCDRDFILDLKKEGKHWNSEK